MIRQNCYCDCVCNSFLSEVIKTDYRGYVIAEFYNLIGGYFIIFGMLSL